MSRDGPALPPRWHNYAFKIGPNAAVKLQGRGWCIFRERCTVPPLFKRDRLNEEREMALQHMLLAASFLFFILFRVDSQNYKNQASQSMQKSELLNLPDYY